MFVFRTQSNRWLLYARKIQNQCVLRRIEPVIRQLCWIKSLLVQNQCRRKVRINLSIITWLSVSWIGSKLSLVIIGGCSMMISFQGASNCRSSRVYIIRCCLVQPYGVEGISEACFTIRRTCWEKLVLFTYIHTCGALLQSCSLFSFLTQN